MQLNDLFGTEYPYATFHDAVVERITLDYAEGRAILECLICIGDPDASDGDAREALQKGHLVFQELLYFVIEPPDPSYPSQSVGGVSVSSDGPVGTNGVNGTHLLSNLPDQAFAHYFFVSDWNAFAYIAAKRAEFEWVN